MENGDCIKCQGTGKVVWLNVDNGRCFDCGGTGRFVPKKTRATRAAAPKKEYDPALELRRLYAAARSQGAEEWIEPEFGHDPDRDGPTGAELIAKHLSRAPAPVAARAEAAFRALLGRGWRRVEEARASAR